MSSKKIMGKNSEVAYEVMTCKEEDLSDLESVLRVLPLSVHISAGRRLSARGKKPIELPAKLYVRWAGGEVFSVEPESGARISGGCFYGEYQNAISPSRVFDECIARHEGETNSYYFNTQDLGLPFSRDLMIDVHKYGRQKN